MHRFYLPPEKLAAMPLELGGDEFHHLANVLRAKVGDRITVFDGAGNECLCAVATIQKRSITLSTLQRSNAPPLPYAITLAQALPKGTAMDTIVQKATELGAHAIQPLISDRTVAKLSDAEAKKKRERWRQISIEAAKQCGVNWLPEIMPVRIAAEFLRQPQKFDLKLIGSLQPGAMPLRKILADSLRTEGRSSPTRSTNAPTLSRSDALTALLLIGPEGDFTPSELATAKTAGCLPLSLGPLILRSETAAIAALSVLAYEMNLMGTGGTES